MRPVAIGTATIRDVARAAQVSVASASRALNGHHSVTPATRERVLSAAQALNYVPHIGARSLSTRRSRSEEHTSELQSLMRISYAVFCLKKKNTLNNT